MPEFDHLVNDPYVISRVYIVLCILVHFMGYICPRSLWPQRVYDLINSFPNIPQVNIRDMGFLGNWEELLLQKKSE